LVIEVSLAGSRKLGKATAEKTRMEVTILKCSGLTAAITPRWERVFISLSSYNAFFYKQASLGTDPRTTRIYGEEGPSLREKQEGRGLLAIHGYARCTLRSATSRWL
jgi:hypothetical protein